MSVRNIVDGTIEIPSVAQTTRKASIHLTKVTYSGGSPQEIDVTIPALALVTKSYYLVGIPTTNLQPIEVEDHDIDNTEGTLEIDGEDLSGLPNQTLQMIVVTPGDKFNFGTITVEEDAVCMTFGLNVDHNNELYVPSQHFAFNRIPDPA